MKRDIWYGKLGIQVVERNKTYDLRKSRNVRKLLNLGAEIDVCPTSLPETKLWQ